MKNMNDPSMGVWMCLWLAIIGVLITLYFTAERGEWGNVVCMATVAMFLFGACWFLLRKGATA